MGVEGQSQFDELASARETISRQADEITLLREQHSDEQFAAELRVAVSAAVASGIVSAPATTHRLLEMIVRTAAEVLSAHAASLFLLDEETQELVFAVALGDKAAEVAPFRVPIGHGIAGLVALSGQAMAISDAANDARQASDIAEKIGYRPQNLLCVPLVSGDRIIGVLELLDKEGDASFTPSDMELLGHFASLAGAAIAQSRVPSAAGVLDDVIRSIEGISGEQRDTLVRRARTFGARMEENDPSYEHVLRLVRLVQTIVAYGEDASVAVETVLRGFETFLSSAPQFNGMSKVS